MLVQKLVLSLLAYPILAATKSKRVYQAIAYAANTKSDYHFRCSNLSTSSQKRLHKYDVYNSIAISSAVSDDRQKV